MSSLGGVFPTIPQWRCFGAVSELFVYHLNLIDLAETAANSGRYLHALVSSSNCE